jgi:hypothetical protein
MQRTHETAMRESRIQFGSSGKRRRVDGNDRIYGRSAFVIAGDPAQVLPDETAAGQVPGREGGMDA